MNASYRTYKSQSIQELLTPPETPSTPQSDSKLVHTWPEPETEPEEISIEHQDKYASEFPSDTACNNFNVTHQEVLLLHGPKQKYIYNREHPIPSLQNDREMLIAVHAVGLNPIDWKAPDFGFGLPALPCISGRDFAGKVVMTARKDSRFKAGDLVMAVSTDYRDSRKGAYQQYSVVSDFNACRIPENIATTEAAPLGVAFVAAALALGICFGVDFTRTSIRASGPDLLHMVRSLSRESLPKDIRAECFDGITEDERPEPGEWIAIWGGSSATGRCVVQLAKLAGFKVIAIIDVARSGERMLDYGADLLVDRIDTERAISIVQGVTKGRLRFGFNAHERETAKLLTKAMHGKDGKRAHLVGLTGLPKEAVDGIVYHSVPIKCFHEAPQVGEALMIWLEQLLEQNVLSMLDIEVAPGGLEGINAALDRLRDGSVSARIVVPLDINRREDTK